MHLYAKRGANIVSEASRKPPQTPKIPALLDFSLYQRLSSLMVGMTGFEPTILSIKYEPDLATITRKLETIFSIITFTHLQINQMIDAGIQSLNSTPGFILYNSAKTPILPTPISISAKKYAPP